MNAVPTIPVPPPTIWQRIASFWRGHGTKFLGGVQVVLGAAVGTSGIVPEHYLKWVLFGNSLIGAWVVKRGFYNSSQQP